MDRLTRYRHIIRQVLADFARCKPANGEIENELVVDTERDHFELLHVGWDGSQRVHGTVIHIDIIGDKVWIQYDGTNRPVADELMAAGIPQQDLVLAWHPRELRHYTGFALRRRLSVSRPERLGRYSGVAWFLANGPFHPIFLRLWLSVTNAVTRSCLGAMKVAALSAHPPA